MAGTPRNSKPRMFQFTDEEAAKVFEACPNAEWRLIFALSRFGGLRCTSEHAALRWIDINWEHDRMTVHSPKTEHHEGKESRVVPIFPELRPYLDEVWEQAEKGAEYVLSRRWFRRRNIRTHFERIIRQAGLKPWPKLSQNWRSTRETELAERFPIQVVCEWIGNTPAVAKRHYLQVTEEHFARAVQPEVAPRAERAANALHQCGESPCNTVNVSGGKAAIPAVCTSSHGIPKSFADSP